MKRKRDDSDAATSSSTGGVSESLGDEFDVFLNFRGPDTRLNFTDHLYHSLDGAGIRVFLDDAEIRKGEKIGGELLRAINNSRIYVPIFSRDYASSAWCLRELVHMVECLRRSTDKAILPIFFNVDPYDVKLGTGLYSDALKKHEDRFSYDELRRWKEALTEVASIKGWHCKDIGQGELIKLVTNEVSRKLSRGVGVVPDHLIGIDDHVQAVMDLLGKDSLDVRFVVIHGMSGIGKTTLAKVVFNQIASQFQGCSFLSNVCEFSQLGKIVKLQNRLLSEILKSQSIKVQDTDSGINMIRGRCRHKKVLIVLDNLDKRDQLAKLAEKCDWFGSGSRIIVTTKDISFLKIYKNNVSMHPKAYQFYEMGEMHDSLAIRLFSRYAFESDTPPLEYDKITREIVKITGGLPLALVVIGSSLCNESEEGWDDVLAKLKKMPHKEVQDILKGTEKNNGTQTRGQSQVCNITCEDISELVKLRLLEFDGGNFVGDFQDLLLELRWLYKQQ